MKTLVLLVGMLVCGFALAEQSIEEQFRESAREVDERYWRYKENAQIEQALRQQQESINLQRQQIYLERLSERPIAIPGYVKHY